MKLRNMMQRFSHVTLIENDDNRKHYTNHGLHLNRKGKDVLPRSMANLINKLILVEETVKPIITLNWKGETTRSVIAQVSEGLPRNSNSESSDQITNRSSTRQKKTTGYKKK